MHCKTFGALCFEGEINRDAELQMHVMKVNSSSCLSCAVATQTQITVAGSV